MSSSGRELVLTGLSDFWPQDEATSLFLGPWCFAHNERHRFRDYVHFSVVPSPFASTDAVVSACRYVGTLCDRLIPSLALSLNRLHHTHHPEAFWRVATITWLLHWVGACYDRYHRLCHALDMYGKERRLHVTIVPTSKCYVGDWSDFSHRLSGHLYNLQLMSDILSISRRLGGLQCEVKPVAQSCLQPPVCNRRHPTEAAGAFRRLRQGSRRWMDRLLLLPLSLGNPSFVLGGVPGVSRWDKFVLRSCLDPFSFLRPRKHNSCARQIHVAAPIRDDTPLAFDAQSDFESVVARILPAHVPAPLTTVHPDDVSRKRQPRLWIGNDAYGDMRRIYGLAHIVASGGKWMSAQHGGGYGQVLEVGHGKIEYETSDGFVSWGWVDESVAAGSFHPLPSPHLSTLPRHSENNSHLILVGTAVPAYHYRFHSLVQPEHIMGTLEWRRRFIAHTEAGIRRSTFYRPYSIDYGIDEVDYVLEASPECRVLHNASLTDVMSQSRLVVIDHVATALLQALAMNVPTVLFWNPDVYVLHPTARNYFDTLRSVGVLHDSPEGAACKVNDVWSDVAQWWRGAAIQDARRRFVNRYARTSSHWRREWAAFLRSQLQEATSLRERRVTTSRPAVS